MHQVPSSQQQMQWANTSKPSRPTDWTFLKLINLQKLTEINQIIFAMQQMKKSTKTENSTTGRCYHLLTEAKSIIQWWPRWRSTQTAWWQVSSKSVFTDVTERGVYISVFRTHFQNWVTLFAQHKMIFFTLRGIGARAP